MTVFFGKTCGRSKIGRTLLSFPWGNIGVNPNPLVNLIQLINLIKLIQLINLIQLIKLIKLIQLIPLHSPPYCGKPSAATATRGATAVGAPCSQH